MWLLLVKQSLDLEQKLWCHLETAADIFLWMEIPDLFFGLAEEKDRRVRITRCTVIYTALF